MKMQLGGDAPELGTRRVGDVDPAGLLAMLGYLRRRTFHDRRVVLDEKTSTHRPSIGAAIALKRLRGEAPHDLDELFRIERFPEIRLGVASVRLAAGIIDAGEDHERDATKR